MWMSENVELVGLQWDKLGAHVHNKRWKAWKPFVLSDALQRVENVLSASICVFYLRLTHALFEGHLPGCWSSCPAGCISVSCWLFS